MIQRAILTSAWRKYGSAIRISFVCALIAFFLTMLTYQPFIVSK